MHNIYLIILRSFIHYQAKYFLTDLINSKFNALKQLDKVSKSTEHVSESSQYVNELDVSETTR